MVLVTFFYFVFQTLWSYKKEGWNISAYLFLLYAVTSFFACGIVFFTPNSELAKVDNGFIPTFVYCFLITCTIAPFRNLKLNKPICLNKGIKVFNFISYFYIGLFFLMLILFSSNIYSILVNGNFYIMRIQGGVSGLGNTNVLLRTVMIAFGELSSLMLFFFFYSIAYLKRSKKFNILLFVSSLSMILLGIMNIDRSRIFYWIVIFGLALTIFLPHLSKKEKRTAFLMFGIVGFVLVMYFMAVSVSRFDRGDSNVENGLLSYAGQPYLQFCDYFNNYEPPEINFHHFFPNIYHFFIDGYSTAVEIGERVELKTGKFVNVFYTYLGSIMLDSGRFFMLIFVFLYVSIVKFFMPRNKVSNSISFWKVMQVFLFALIPACGIILYYISSPIMALGFYVLIGLSILGNCCVNKL